MPRIERDFPAELQIHSVLNMAALRREASQANIQLDTRRDAIQQNQDKQLTQERKVAL